MKLKLEGGFELSQQYDSGGMLPNALALMNKQNYKRDRLTRYEITLRHHMCHHLFHLGMATLVPCADGTC